MTKKNYVTAGTREKELEEGAIGIWRPPQGLFIAITLKSRWGYYKSVFVCVWGILKNKGKRAGG